MSPRAVLLAGGALVLAAATGGAAAPALADASASARTGGATSMRDAAWGGQGGTGQGIVAGSRDQGARPSRDSSREAMAAASGAKAKPASSRQAREANAEIAKLAASAEEAAKELAQDAWQLPINRGAYRLTAEFGQCSGLWAHCHTGLDFAAPSGTSIRSIAGGVVSRVGWAGAYGNRTIVTLKDGTEAWYCHQLDVGVKPGDNVFSGQVIGRVGATGNTTGPHLHLEVRPGGGDAVDPADALGVHGATP